jgi:hypothetical protein
VKGARPGRADCSTTTDQFRRLRAPALIRAAPGLPDGHLPAIYPLGFKVRPLALNQMTLA